MEGRILFLRGDLWRALGGHEPAGGAHLIVANPPYVPSEALDGLMPEVRWEPRLALDGGPGGLRVLREIVAGAPAHLRPGGGLLMEIGADQGAAVVGCLEDDGRYEACRVIRDLAGRDRVVAARRRADGN